MRQVTPRLAAILLFAFHFIAFFAGFFAPYGYAEQNRSFPYAPPSELHVWDSNTGPSLFTYAQDSMRNGSDEDDPRRRVPIRFFTHGSRYPILGNWLSNWTSDLHLFGVEAAQPFFLLGSDLYGRDQFSRLLYGGRTSLFTALLAALVSLSVGATLGTLAGLGGWIDEAVMRISEISLAVPSIYLLLTVRALLPLRTAPDELFLVLVASIGLTGWGRPARLIRGVVLTMKTREYIAAARGFGASELYLYRRHILPGVSGVILTQVAVLIPQYLLAEVTLSFVGLGMNEPVPSWGNMLAPLQQYWVLDSYWWMFAPACAAVPITLAYYILSLALEAGGSTRRT